LCSVKFDGWMKVWGDLWGVGKRWKGAGRGQSRGLRAASSRLGGESLPKGETQPYKIVRGVGMQAGLNFVVYFLCAPLCFTWVDESIRTRLENRMMRLSA
jgi:hypothetical protein